MALALAAGTAEARCTASDVQMTKVFPIGNLGRFDTNAEAIIRFALPSNCPITNPPLEVCVVVWDNSPCDHGLDAVNRCDGNYVGGAGVRTRAGALWTKKGRAQFCSNTLLSESPIPNVPVTSGTMLIRTGLGDFLKAKNEGLQGYLSVIMQHNPVQFLAIPISND